MQWLVSEQLDDVPVSIISNPCISEFLSKIDKITDEALPLAWTHIEAMENGNECYQHDDFWHRGPSGFWRPERTSKVEFVFLFPLGTERQEPADQSFTLNPINYLHCKACRCDLEFSRSKKALFAQESEPPTRMIFAITSMQTHNHAGVMVLSSGPEYPHPGDTLEVVGISSGSFVIPEWDKPPNHRNSWHEHYVLLETETGEDSNAENWFVRIDNQKYYPGDKYKFVDVLWIQPGRPAYRKGLGRIAMRAFRNACHHEEDNIRPQYPVRYLDINIIGCIFKTQFCKSLSTILTPATCLISVDLSSSIESRP
jgi:hypothetical protein